jgi:hypothetical protein
VTTRRATVRARRNASRRLALHDFERTGAQDCGNTFTVEDFNIDDHLDPPDPKAAFDGGMMDECDWLEQHQDGDDFDGLDPHACYLAWLSGFEQCAIPILTDAIDARVAARLEDMTVFYLATAWDEMIERFSSKTPSHAIRDALDMLARMDRGEVYWGDGNGPNDKLVTALPDSDLLLWIFGDTNANDKQKRDAWHAIGSPGKRPPRGSPEHLDDHFVEQRKALRARGYRWVETDTRAKKK